MRNMDKGVSSGRAQSTPPMVRKAHTAAMARASLSDCVVASCSSFLEGRTKLAVRRKNQHSHSE